MANNKELKNNRANTSFSGTKVVPGILDKEIKAGFFTEDGIIKEELIAYVEEFAEELKNCRITKTDIQNLYNSIKSIQLSIEQEFAKNLPKGNGELKDEKIFVFKRVYPLVRLIKIKSSCALKRKSKKTKQIKKKNAYIRLKFFIDAGVNQIKTKEEFDLFINLFEHMVGNLDTGK